MIRLKKYSSNSLQDVHNPTLDIYLNKEYVSNSLEYVYKPMIGQRTKWTAQTASAEMSTANSNLNGSGTLYTLLTGGTRGTYIKTITVKAIKLVTRGMVRIYVDSGLPTDIISEIEIPPRSVDPSQETFAISIEVDFMLEQDWILKASIENGSENTMIFAEGLDISYP